MVGQIPPHPWLATKFKPLVLPPFDRFGDLPHGHLKVLPKFNKENDIAIEDHLTAFQDCTSYFYVEDDGVFSRMFSHSLG